VDPDKPFAILVHEGEQVRLLLGRHLGFAVGVENNCIEVIKVAAPPRARAALGIIPSSPDLTLGHEDGVRAQKRNVSAAVPAQTFQRSDCVTDCIVGELITRVQIGHDEHLLLASIRVAQCRLGG